MNRERGGGGEEEGKVYEQRGRQAKGQTRSVERGWGWKGVLTHPPVSQPPPPPGKPTNTTSKDEHGRLLLRMMCVD